LDLVQYHFSFCISNSAAPNRNLTTRRKMGKELDKERNRHYG
jgi:hypothetical protein